MSALVKSRPDSIAAALRQLKLLIGLWWRHMRRRPTRLGDAPRVSGVPTFLLINLISIAYMVLLVFQNVARSVHRDRGMFFWHMLGVLLIGFAFGLSKGAARLQVRGMRNDAFLEPLPLHPLARLGLQLADAFVFIPLALTVPFAALSAQPFHASSLGARVALGLFAFVACFVAGAAAIAWARVLGPSAVARYGIYVAVALNVIGMSALFMPFGSWMRSPAHSLPRRVAALWLGPSPALAFLYVATIAFSFAAYRALALAERGGLDQLDAQIRTPKPHEGGRDRRTLEWLMMLRQGGRPLIVIYSAMVLAAIWTLFMLPLDRLPPSALLFAAGFAIYLGALQTIAQAGRAARSDLLARSFLAALPLSPHEVLEGKARALRRLLLPVLVLLALIAGYAGYRGDLSRTYRVILSLLSLYVVVDGAVSVAFLSSGIGVVGIGGGQASSGFSTQILMLPLFATVMAPNDWAATTAFIAVLAVSRESLRAARLSVRWLDDPTDDVERETTVWRALLAATAFFAMQALSYRTFSLFDLPSGYLFTFTFGSAAVLLALLTWRNGARFERPRFLPQKLWCWPLGPIFGAGSGLLALEIAKRLPAPAEDAQSFSTGELVALFVTMTMVAPLVEEYFFRGWLQRAIEADLPEAKKRWAFALGAAAFALAHLGTYGIPQLVLGLLAGWLFARGGGLWPGILAHATHNGVVLLLAK